MEGQNLEIQLSNSPEMHSRLSAGKKLVNVLRYVQEILSKFGKESEAGYEKLTIGKQMKIYGMGKEKHWWQLFNYDKSEFDPTYGSQVLDPFIKRLGLNNNTPLVLDLGAGKAASSVYMETKGMKTIKADISNSGLTGQKNTVQATSWALPFSDDSFDGIHSKDMITHIPFRFRNKLFSELYRVMKPGGVVLLCSANQESLADYQYPTSKKGLIKLAEEHGFTVENTEEWRPSSKFKDWYSTRRPRFVLELRK